tara:strand:- start:621 stop:998 length:378 start_codon:yes stop_codon:yes gene_type:complete
MSSYFTRALEALKPNSTWTVIGDQYSRLTWLDKNQTKPTEEEINAKITELQNAEPHKLLRIERDKRLTACDWVVAKHTEHGKMVPEDWKIYRQALRDLPNISYRPELDEFGDLKMDSVAWPTPPE